MAQSSWKQSLTAVCVTCCLISAIGYMHHLKSLEIMNSLPKQEAHNTAILLNIPYNTPSTRPGSYTAVPLVEPWPKTIEEVRVSTYYRKALARYPASQRNDPEFRKMLEQVYLHPSSLSNTSSGYDAGYEWARDHEISDPNDCSDNPSSSFIDGCEQFAEEQ